jgi:hypothetical protein
MAVIEIPLAHTAHHAVYVLYAVPVVVVLGSIVAGAIRERRERLIRQPRP